MANLYKAEGKPFLFRWWIAQVISCSQTFGLLWMPNVWRITPIDDSILCWEPPPAHKPRDKGLPQNPLLELNHRSLRTSQAVFTEYMSLEAGIQTTESSTEILGLRLWGVLPIICMIALFLCLGQCQSPLRMIEETFARRELPTFLNCSLSRYLIKRAYSMPVVQPKKDDVAI